MVYLINVTIVCSIHVPQGVFQPIAVLSNDVLFIKFTP